MASNMPVGRGRGRGRAIISSQLQRPGGEPAAQKSTKDHIKDLNPKTLESTIEYLTRRTVSQEVLNEATTELCTRVLNDVDFVKLAVELIDKLWNSNEPDNVSIRKPLLSKLQEFYKTRDNLLEGELQAYATLLAELFSILRLSDQPLKAFVAPVYNILKDLIDREDKDQNNILTFHDIILRHGFLLDKQDQVKNCWLVGWRAPFQGLVYVL